VVDHGKRTAPGAQNAHAGNEKTDGEHFLGNLYRPFFCDIAGASAMLLLTDA